MLFRLKQIFCTTDFFNQYRGLKYEIFSQNNMSFWCKLRFKQMNHSKQFEQFGTILIACGLKKTKTDYNQKIFLFKKWCQRKQEKAGLIWAYKFRKNIFSAWIEVSLGLLLQPEASCVLLVCLASKKIVNCKYSKKSQEKIQSTK